MEPVSESYPVGVTKFTVHAAELRFL